MPQASLPSLSEGLRTATNLPSWKRYYFITQMRKRGRERLSALLSIAQEICGKAQRRVPAQRSNHNQATRSQKTWSRENPYEKKITRHKISTYSQITVQNKFGATKLPLPTVFPPLHKTGSMLNSKCHGGLGWAASRFCLLAPVLLACNP